MNICAPFIVRPIATILLAVAVVLVGLLGYSMLSVAALPTVEFPTIQVVTTYPGASPDVVQSSVSAPLEYHLGRIPGLTVMTSSSSYGVSQITLQFSLSRNIASASQDVEAAIAASAGWLPVTLLPAPPTYHQVNPADMPVLVAGADLRHDAALCDHRIRLDRVRPQAVAGRRRRRRSPSRRPGARGAPAGQSREARRPRACRSRTFAGRWRPIRSISRRARSTAAQQSFQIGDNDQLFVANAYRDVIIAYRNGSPVMFKDVGNAVEGLENEKLAGCTTASPRSS